MSRPSECLSVVSPVFFLLLLASASSSLPNKSSRPFLVGLQQQNQHQQQPQRSLEVNFLRQARWVRTPELTPLDLSESQIHLSASDEYRKPVSLTSRMFRKRSRDEDMDIDASSSSQSNSISVATEEDDDTHSEGVDDDEPLLVKKAFSLFNRMKPLHQVFAYNSPETDFVSAVTRGASRTRQLRPVGQPLRWGRKRR